MKETILSLVRTAATFIGSYLISSGKISESVVTQGIVIVVMLASIGWGIFDKTNNLEKWQSLVRSLVVFIGGFLISRGKITTEQVDQFLAFVLPLLAFIDSWIMRVKNSKIKEAQVKSDAAYTSKLKT